MNDRQLKQILTTRRVGSERKQRNAAILLPVVEVAGRDNLLFEVRSQRLEMQPGEVHFTGTVYPLLGRMDALALPNLKLNEDEVEEVFTVPLEFFLSCPGKQYTYYMSPDNLEELPSPLADYIRHYRQKYVTPAWCYSGHTIWGMTARAVNKFLNFLRSEA